MPHTTLEQQLDNLILQSVREALRRGGDLITETGVPNAVTIFRFIDQTQNPRASDYVPRSVLLPIIKRFIDHPSDTYIEAGSTVQTLIDRFVGADMHEMIGTTTSKLKSISSVQAGKAVASSSPDPPFAQFILALKRRAQAKGQMKARAQWRNGEEPGCHNTALPKRIVDRSTKSVPADKVGKGQKDLKPGSFQTPASRVSVNEPDDERIRTILMSVMRSLVLGDEAKTAAFFKISEKDMTAYLAGQRPIPARRLKDFHGALEADAFSNRQITGYPAVRDMLADLIARQPPPAPARSRKSKPKRTLIAQTHSSDTVVLPADLNKIVKASPVVVAEKRPDDTEREHVAASAVAPFRVAEKHVPIAPSASTEQVVPTVTSLSEGTSVEMPTVAAAVKVKTPPPFKPAARQVEKPVTPTAPPIVTRNKGGSAPLPDRLIKEADDKPSTAPAISAAARRFAAFRERQAAAENTSSRRGHPTKIVAEDNDDDFVRPLDEIFRDDRNPKPDW